MKKKNSKAKKPYMPRVVCKMNTWTRTMISYYTICYAAYTADGERLDSKSKHMMARIEASSPDEAVNKLKKSLPGVEVYVVGKPVLMHMAQAEYDAQE